MTSGKIGKVTDVSVRRVLGLAFPAMVVLAAEPLYLVVDTALVGHLGAGQLAALAIGAIVLAQVSGQFNFLAYGTTGRAARMYGRRDRAGAVREGVNASVLAVILGVVLIGVVELFAYPIARLLGGNNSVAVAEAVGWMRIAILGAPGILLALAGNGWMRGVQQTRKPTIYVVIAFGISLVLSPIFIYGVGWGLRGSAIANVIAQLIGGTLFVSALLREGLTLRPTWTIMKAQLRTGRDLVIRTVALQGAFAAAAAFAARMSAETLGAHQIGLQVWMLCALVLDSVAIAAQSLVGQSLGAGTSVDAHRVAAIISRLGFFAGIILAVFLLLIKPFAPHIFTSDPQVLAQASVMWWWLAGMQPFAGYVFAQDGILMGASDVGVLRTFTIIASLVYIPIAFVALAQGWGIGGIWFGLSMFIAVRLVLGWWRVRSGRWITPDAQETA